MAEIRTYPELTSLENMDWVLGADVSVDDLVRIPINAISNRVSLDFGINDTLITLPDGRSLNTATSSIAGVSLLDIPTAAPGTDNRLYKQGEFLKISGAKTDLLNIESDNSGSDQGPTLDLYRNSPSSVNGDEGGAIDFSANTSAGTKYIGARINQIIEDAGTSTSRLSVEVSSGGALNNIFDIKAGEVDVNGNLVVTGTTTLGTTLTGILRADNGVVSISNIDEVSANPGGSPATTLTTLRIGNTDYALAGGGTANVQSDWNETDNTVDSYILNKPRLRFASSQNIFDGGLTVNDLPSTDPNIDGALWNYNGSIVMSGIDTSASGTVLVANISGFDAAVTSRVYGYVDGNGRANVDDVKIISTVTDSSDSSPSLNAGIGATAAAQVSAGDVIQFPNLGDAGYTVSVVSSPNVTIDRNHPEFTSGEKILIYKYSDKAISTVPVAPKTTLTYSFDILDLAPGVANLPVAFSGNSGDGIITAHWDKTALAGIGINLDGVTKEDFSSLIIDSFSVNPIDLANPPSWLTWISFEETDHSIVISISKSTHTGTDPEPDVFQTGAFDTVLTGFTITDKDYSYSSANRIEATKLHSSGDIRSEENTIVDGVLTVAGGSKLNGLTSVSGYITGDVGVSNNLNRMWIDPAGGRISLVGPSSRGIYFDTGIFDVGSMPPFTESTNLSDYEEGTWTPFNVGQLVSNGNYVRVGNGYTANGWFARPIGGTAILTTVSISLPLTIGTYTSWVGGGTDHTPSMIGTWFIPNYSLGGTATQEGGYILKTGTVSALLLRQDGTNLNTTSLGEGDIVEFNISEQIT